MVAVCVLMVLLLLGRAGILPANGSAGEALACCKDKTLFSHPDYDRWYRIRTGSADALAHGAPSHPLAGSPDFVRVMAPARHTASEEYGIAALTSP